MLAEWPGYQKRSLSFQQIFFTCTGRKNRKKSEHRKKTASEHNNKQQQVALFA